MNSLSFRVPAPCRLAHLKAAVPLLAVISTIAPGQTQDSDVGDLSKRQSVSAPPTTSPADALPAVEPGTPTEPLPFPVYVASQLEQPIAIDGKLDEPAWRRTALGWGMSHALEPNLLCPDPTLFRIAWDVERLYFSLACYQREKPEPLPDHLWRPKETELLDIQVKERHARERGDAAPINTTTLLLSHEGRTATFVLEPGKPPKVSIHDSVGDRKLDLAVEHAYSGTGDDPLWTIEAQVSWKDLGFAAPAPDQAWTLNVYREIRYLSNWSFIAWMRDWNKAEYSRYDLTERFGRIVFAGPRPDVAAITASAKELAKQRGPVQVFTVEALLLVEADGDVVTQRYADRLKELRAFTEGIRRERSRIANDLPYYPFFSEKKPREHLSIANKQLGNLYNAAAEKDPAWGDPAVTVARIAHAIAEARQGLYAYRKERLYRGLPE